MKMAKAILATCILTGALVIGFWFGIPDALTTHLELPPYPDSAKPNSTSLEDLCLEDDMSTATVWRTVLTKEHDNCHVEHDSTARNGALWLSLAAVATCIICFALTINAIQHSRRATRLTLAVIFIFIGFLALLNRGVLDSLHYYWRLGGVNMFGYPLFWVLLLPGVFLVLRAAKSHEP